MKNKLLVALLSLAALVSVSAAQAEVARSIITTGVVDREPTNDLVRIQPGTERVIFFTELRDETDKTVTHVWKYDGEVMAEVKFDVGGPRWRVWSSKNIMPEWSGDWTVTVVDNWGNTLTEKSFTVVAAESTDSMEGEEMTGEMSGEEAAPMEEESAMEEPAADAAMDEGSDGAMEESGDAMMEKSE